MNMHFPFAKTSIAARTSEEEDIIKSLKEIRDNIEGVYDRLNYSQDELITDSLNYELLALKSRHRFYLQKAKELRVKNCNYYGSV